MESSKWIWIFSLVAILCISSTGSALPILDPDDEGIFLRQVNEYPLVKRTHPASVYDPEAAWTHLEATQDADRIENVLKRSGFHIPDSYQRFPRIKERVIIPFFSYEKHPGYYRSRPRLPSRPRASYGYNPWNMESSKNGNRFHSKGVSRYGK